MTSLSAIEEVLGYRFRNPGLGEEALCHRSFVHESATSPGLKDNERLEFLGDAVLNLAVGRLLMDRFPQAPEGDLSRLRAGLVNERQLARIARRLELGAAIKLGRGEQISGGREKDSILAGALEALLAAVFLDGGFEAAFAILERTFGPLLEELEPEAAGGDCKSRLQELAQARPGALPQYTILREEGPDHAKTFRVRLKVLGIETEGVGRSKKAAEQDAACRALERLSGREPASEP